MLTLLEKLCALSGVSGQEDSVRDFLRDQAAPYAQRVETDVLGNLIVEKQGAVRSRKKLMLTAHMDEVGVMVTDITPDGYLKFAPVGGIDRRVLLGKPVYVGPGRVPGVLGVKAVHLLSPAERKAVPPLQDFYIDIGAESREAAEARVSLGDVGVFAPVSFAMGSLFRGKAIDDRLGCAVLLKLIQSPLPVDCTFVFSVQEEVGTRGAFGAAFRVQPDIALVVEATTAADLPSVKTNKRICAPGNGVVIPFMDRGAIYDRELYRLLTGLAEKNGIPWQTKTYVAGGTDASAIQRSRGGVQTAGIAAAVRNIHSPACVAHTGDMEGVCRLAALFLEEMGKIYGVH